MLVLWQELSELQSRLEELHLEQKSRLEQEMRVAEERQRAMQELDRDVGQEFGNHYPQTHRAVTVEY